MKTIIKIVLTYIIAVCVFFPLLAIFNNSDNLLVNLAGFAYLMILCIIGHTKVGKMGLKYLSDASNKIDEWLGKFN